MGNTRRSFLHSTLKALPKALTHWFAVLRLATGVRLSTQRDGLGDCHRQCRVSTVGVKHRDFNTIVDVGTTPQVVVMPGIRTIDQCGPHIVGLMKQLPTAPRVQPDIPSRASNYLSYIPYPISQLFILQAEQLNFDTSISTWHKNRALIFRLFIQAEKNWNTINCYLLRITNPQLPETPGLYPSISSWFLLRPVCIHCAMIKLAITWLPNTPQANYRPQQYQDRDDFEFLSESSHQAHCV